MKVLLAIDGSAPSFEALLQACRMLSPQRDRILLFYAPPTFSVAAAIDISFVEQGQTALANSIFSEALARLPDSWKPAVQQIIGSGDPRSGILQCAQQEQAQFIVVGARGLGPVGRAVLGSVSRSVVHAAKTPVLVARALRHAQPSSGLRVLLACESAESGRWLAETLHEFQWPAESVCTPVRVVATLLGGAVPDWLKAQIRSPDVDEMIKAWKQEQTQALSAAQQDLLAVGSSLPSSLRGLPPAVSEGHAGTEIVETARKQDADLIVMGAKQTTLLGRLFVGSTCEFVLNHAPCSVLVCRHL